MDDAERAEGGRGERPVDGPGAGPAGRRVGAEGLVRPEGMARPERSVAEARRFAVELAALLRDERCTDIVVLDVRGVSHVSDYLVLASGTSVRQLVNAVDKAREFGASVGHGAVRSNEDDRSTWLLVDFVDVVAHLFEPNTRAYYDLEMLWGDAERVAWESEAGKPSGAGA